MKPEEIIYEPSFYSERLDHSIPILHYHVGALMNALDGDPERRAKILGRTPMDSFGQPDDIGWAAVYLCSSAARFVTGAVLPVDGGASIGF